jgi:hypothetical protein
VVICDLFLSLSLSRVTEHLFEMQRGKLSMPHSKVITINTKNAQANVLLRRQLHQRIKMAHSEVLQSKRSRLERACVNTKNQPIKYQVIEPCAGKDELLMARLLTAPQQRYALFFKSSMAKVAGPAAIAASLLRSMGSVRRTGQINESIRIADNPNDSRARAQLGD